MIGPFRAVLKSSVLPMEALRHGPFFIFFSLPACSGKPCIEPEMKLLPNLKLRKVGKQYMVVRHDAHAVDLANVYTLNETAAWLWNIAAEADFTATTLAEALCSRYDVEPARAEADVQQLISQWQANGLIAD